MSAPLKPTVMFADHVSTLGGSSPSVSVISGIARKPAVSGSKRGYLNGMLIGLMSIVFGLGIMYLLSRLMQVSRRQQQLERQVKDTSVNLDELALQVHILATAPKQPPVQQQVPLQIPTPVQQQQQQQQPHQRPPQVPQPVHVQVPVPPKAPPMQRQVQVPCGFIDIPLPFLLNEHDDALLDFFGDIISPGLINSNSTSTGSKVEEVVECEEERKETDVKSIVQQTMEPIAQVVDELKKQSEKTTASDSDDDSSSSSSSSSEEEKTKQPPTRRTTRATAASRKKK